MTTMTRTMQARARARMKTTWRAVIRMLTGRAVMARRTRRPLVAPRRRVFRPGSGRPRVVLGVCAIFCLPQEHRCAEKGGAAAGSSVARPLIVRSYTPRYIPVVRAFAWADNACLFLSVCCVARGGGCVVCGACCVARGVGRTHMAVSASGSSPSVTNSNTYRSTGAFRSPPRYFVLYCRGLIPGHPTSSKNLGCAAMCSRNSFPGSIRTIRPQPNIEAVAQFIWNRTSRPSSWHFLRCFLDLSQKFRVVIFLDPSSMRARRLRWK